MDTKTKDLTKNNGAIAPIEKNIADNILNRVSKMEKEGGLQFPANYSYTNALKSAWLVLQTVSDRNGKPALSVCSKESIANALFDMVIQGLSPAKKQCYFIVYGAQLQLQRSYFGTVAVTKRLANVKDAFARIIYEGDVLEYHYDTSSMMLVIDKHEQKLSNINPDKIIGAYPVVVLNDGTLDIGEPMTIEQIRKAWNQGPTKGGSPAHKNFPEEMSKKTVLNRKCKMYFNTSDDSDLLIDAINRTTANEYIDSTDYEEVIENEVEEKANKILLDVNLSEEDKPQTQPQNGTDWENTISVIAAIEQIKNTDELNKFKKENKKRLEMLRGEKNVMEALDKKENDVLRGF